MTAVHLSIRRIDNGFVVNDGRQQRINSDGAGERFFATFEEVAAALPETVLNALNQAESFESQMRNQREYAMNDRVAQLAGGALGRVGG